MVFVKKSAFAKSDIEIRIMLRNKKKAEADISLPPYF